MLTFVRKTLRRLMLGRDPVVGDVWCGKDKYNDPFVSIGDFVIIEAVKCDFVQFKYGGTYGMTASMDVLSFMMLFRKVATAR